jgi:hypothetical protein
MMTLRFLFTRNKSRFLRISAEKFGSDAIDAKITLTIKVKPSDTRNFNIDHVITWSGKITTSKSNVTLFSNSEVEKIYVKENALLSISNFLLS